MSMGLGSAPSSSMTIGSSSTPRAIMSVWTSEKYAVRTETPVVGELDAEPAAELLDGRLAHRVRNRPHAVEEGEDRADQDDLAPVGDDLLAAAAATVLATPVTLTASVASMSAVGVLRSVAAFASRPALAITTSSRPNRSTVCGDRGVERRAVANVGDAPEGLGRVQPACPLGVDGSMSTTATLAPDRAVPGQWRRRCRRCRR